MTDGRPVFGTWGVWLEEGDPLWQFCDATMHWDCYSAWPHRPRFAATYFQFWIAHEAADPYWHRAYLDDNVLVTVNPAEPMRSTWIHLKETGSRVDVRLRAWEAWLKSDRSHDDHPTLAAAVSAAKNVLRAAVPTESVLLARIDEARKRPIIEKYLAAQAQQELVVEAREAQRQNNINRYNNACEGLIKTMEQDGLTCSHCGTHSKKCRVARRQGHKTAIICTACTWVVELPIR